MHSQKKQLILWKLSTRIMLILECCLEKKMSSHQGMKVTTKWRWESGFYLMALITCTLNLLIHILIKKLGNLIFFLWGQIGYYLFKPNRKKYAKQGLIQENNLGVELRWGVWGGALSPPSRGVRGQSPLRKFFWHSETARMA